jgi:putative ABC transport system ATP-binding protein
MLIAVRSKIAENTNPEYYQLIKKLIRMRKFNYVLISVLLITSQSCSNASDSGKKVTDSGTSTKEMPVSVENAAIQQTTSSVKQQLTVKQSLDKAKSEGKAVFVVVSGTGATDTDKATAIAKGATTIYKNAVIVQMNRDDASNAQLVAEWRLAGAPLPLILVVSSKGLPTGGYVLNDATAENKKRAIELLQWVGLDDRTTHYPKELSAGQQQRVAIARALANNPDILLADEPTGNLDPGLSAEILGILKEINQKHNTTVVMVTHSPVAADFGTKKIQLKNGRLQDHELNVNVEQLIN